MKTILSIAVVTAAILGASPAWAGERTIRLAVSGMTCPSCFIFVQSAISGVEGVKNVSTSMSDGTATVTFDDSVTNVKAIADATGEYGYPSRPLGQSG